jgi:hypothetical protein
LALGEWPIGSGVVNALAGRAQNEAINATLAAWISLTQAKNCYAIL